MEATKTVSIYEYEWYFSNKEALTTRAVKLHLFTCLSSVPDIMHLRWPRFLQDLILPELIFANIGESTQSKGKSRSEIL